MCESKWHTNVISTTCRQRMTSKSGRRHPTERKRSAFRAQISPQRGKTSLDVCGCRTDQMFGSAALSARPPPGAKVLAQGQWWQSRFFTNIGWAFARAHYGSVTTAFSTGISRCSFIAFPGSPCHPPLTSWLFDDKSPCSTNEPIMYGTPSAPSGELPSETWK